MARRPDWGLPRGFLGVGVVERASMAMCWMESPLAGCFGLLLLNFQGEKIAGHAGGVERRAWREGWGRGVGPGKCMVRNKILTWWPRRVSKAV